jgi:5,5'-dehydrodivanillate O-demethylase oxygenase subunit
MLSPELNERLTRVGPGTPGGELLRRYWHPICVAAELTEARPKKRVKVLGEELVLFRSPGGGYGLVGEHCSHRGASLFYGFLEEQGIRCPYHGWLYDSAGRCLEQPFEPKGESFCRRIRHPAYPVQKLAGLLFAYMGPEPTPLLPRWDILVREDGDRKIVTGEELACNWLQTQENTVDQTHFAFLHGRMAKQSGLPDQAGYTRPLLKYGFQPFEWGLLTSWHWGDDGSEFGDERAGGNPLLFPTALAHAVRSSRWINWRVPVDDTHTLIFSVEFRLSEGGRIVPQPEDPSAVYLPSCRDGSGDYSMESIVAQDTMAWETQGPIADRTKEHLGAGDRGIVMFRQMLLQQIAIVEEGGEPMGVIRDPGQNTMIELPGLFVDGDPKTARVSGLPVTGAKPMQQAFDERHRIFHVPPGYPSLRPAEEDRVNRDATLASGDRGA